MIWSKSTLVVVNPPPPDATLCDEIYLLSKKYAINTTVIIFTVKFFILKFEVNAAVTLLLVLSQSASVLGS